MAFFYQSKTEQPLAVRSDNSMHVPNYNPSRQPYLRNSETINLQIKKLYLNKQINLQYL